jgi:hypothetical protein
VFNDAILSAAEASSAAKMSACEIDMEESNLV